MPKNKPPTRQTAPAATVKPHNPPTITTHQQWSGPLPPPGALEQFERILPGSAERIFNMVEREQEQRIEQENKALDAAIRDTRRGHWFGIGFLVFAVLACLYSIHIGAAPLVSAALVGAPVAAAAIAFVTGRNKK